MALENKWRILILLANCSFESTIRTKIFILRTRALELSLVRSIIYFLPVYHSAELKACFFISFQGDPPLLSKEGILDVLA